MPLHVLLAQVHLAVLAGHLGMCFLVVLVFLRFGHDLSANRALVVASCAADLMNTELSDFDLFLAGAASLSSYWSFW